MGVLKGVVKQAPVRIHFLKKSSQSKVNLPYGHFGNKYFEQPPCKGT